VNFWAHSRGNFLFYEFLEKFIVNLQLFSPDYQYVIPKQIAKMSDDGISIYDEVEIEDMTFDEAMGVYQFPCPCGDKFQITLEDLLEEQDIAVCPSCSLMIRVIFDLVCIMRHVSYFSANVFSGRSTKASSYRSLGRPGPYHSLSQPNLTIETIQIATTM